MEALCLYREARGTSMPAKAGVLAVIRNRVADKRWPNTSTQVILQPSQFSSFNLSDPNVKKFPIPGDIEWGQWLECCLVVTTPLTADATQGANGYHSFPKPSQYPNWADPLKLTVTIGPFKFYKL